MSEFAKKRVRFGPYEADLETEELWKYGRRLKLGGQPFGILAMLLERPGELVSRESLRTRLWTADTYVDFNQGLNAAVNKLRDCLSDSADAPRYIETLPRRGYRFIAPLGDPVLMPTPAEAPGELQTPGSAATDPPKISRQEHLRPSEFLESQARQRQNPAGRVRFRYRSIALLAVVLALWGFAYSRLSGEKSPKKGVPEGPVFLGGVPRPASDPAFSPEGNRIAFRQIEGEGLGPGIYVSTLGGEKETQLSGSESGCCPVWSPDGESVAFTEKDGDIQNIFLISVRGGAPAKLYSARQTYSRGDIDWSPDGQFLAFSADAANGASQIFALSIQDRIAHPVTWPSSEEIDWGPAYSPDGTQLSFVRGKKSGLAEDLYVQAANKPARAGDEQQLTTGKARILGPPTWTTDSQSILYGSAKDGESRIWRIPSKGGIPEAIASAGVPSWHPTIPRRGTGLAYQHILGATSIWRLDTANLSQKDPRMVVISTAGRNEAPQLSPNGKKLAFMSDRAGSMEIWISDPDGSYPIKLTNLGLCGSPRWSPDSRSLVFDAVHQGRPAVYLVGLGGSEPTELVGGEMENMVPSWSRDGRWIYFASDRSGQDQVWKVPVHGGDPTKVTQEGGFAPVESVDGKYLYYAKSRFDHPEIWQVPLKGGKETLVSPLLRPGIWANWAVTEKGIFFVDQLSDRISSLEYFDLNTRQAHSLVQLNGNSFWLSATSGGETLWYGQSARNESNIMVQPDFH